LKKAFVKLYDHAEDSGMDKIQIHEEALDDAVDKPYLFRKIHLAELDRLGYDEEYKRYGLLGIIGRMGSMVLRAAHIVTYVLRDMHI
jgi:hypothetical protein